MNAHCRSNLGIVLYLLLSWSLDLAASAGGATNAPSSPQAEEQVRGRLAEAQTQLNQWLTFEGSQTNAVPGATPAELLEYKLTLESLVRTCQQHLEEIGRLETARQRVADFKRLDQGWQGFTSQPHYSILVVDDLRDQIQTFSARVAAGESTRSLLVRLSSQNRNEITRAEGTMRRLSEQLETAKDAAEIARLEWQNKLELLRSRLKSAQALLNVTRRQTLETDLEFADLPTLPTLELPPVDWSALDTGVERFGTLYAEATAAALGRSPGRVQEVDVQVNAIDWTPARRGPGAIGGPSDDG